MTMCLCDCVLLFGCGFIHYLYFSFQSINRGLLRWLKLWDFVVFGKENKPATSFVSNVQRRDKKENKLNADKKPFNPSEAIDEHDQLKRPMFKVCCELLWMFSLN